MSSRWADVAKGDDVVINERTYRVTKVKPKGKSVKVTVERSGQAFTSSMPAKGKVKVVGSAGIKAKLHDDTGRQQRWAKPKEAAEVLGRGNPKRTEPSGPESSDPWETPRDRIERKLDTVLGARLVAESDGKGEGYFVPPVDVSTVAAHMVLMHGYANDGADDEANLLTMHEVQHANALKGHALAVNHWHTKTRP